MLCAFYGRVSTQRQENEETIDNQIMAVKDFSQKNGHTIIKEYRDEGWSGTILARPALDELRLDARKKLWEAVIIYDPDRLARKYSYQALIIDELQELGTPALFVTTPPVQTDEDRLLYGVKGIFAEYERVRIADRFRLGRLRKAREGKVMATEAPYGYTYILKREGKEGYYEINKQESEVVKMIFGWVANEGLTIRKTIKRLQELGILPRKSKRGVWNTSTLASLLRNETYIGKAPYNRSFAVVPQKPLKDEKYKKIKKTSRKLKPKAEWMEIPVSRLISDELFEKTGVQLIKNFELSQRNKKNEYLLAGLIYCPCGSLRAGEGPQHGKHLYYRCTDRVKRFPLPPSCKERSVNARIADYLVWGGVSRLMSSPNSIKEQAKRWLDNKTEETNTSGETIEGLTSESEKIKKEKQRYIKLYGMGLIGLGQFEEAVSDLKNRQQSLEAQIGHLATKRQNLGIIPPTEEQIENFAKNSLEVSSDLNFEKKQLVIRRFVNRVIANQQELTVSGCFAMDEYINVKLQPLRWNCWPS